MQTNPVKLLPPPKSKLEIKTMSQIFITGLPQQLTNSKSGLKKLKVFSQSWNVLLLESRVWLTAMLKEKKLVIQNWNQLTKNHQKLWNRYQFRNREVILSLLQFLNRRNNKELRQLKKCTVEVVKYSSEWIRQFHVRTQGWDLVKEERLL